MHELPGPKHHNAPCLGWLLAHLRSTAAARHPTMRGNALLCSRRSTRWEVRECGLAWPSEGRGVSGVRACKLGAWVWASSQLHHLPVWPIFAQAVDDIGFAGSMVWQFLPWSGLTADHNYDFTPEEVGAPCTAAGDWHLVLLWNPRA